MGKTYNAAEVPEVGINLPGGRYVFKIEELDDSQETSTGKYQIKTNLRVEQPAQFVGSPYYENFVIGSNDDPTADTPDVWKSFAAGRYRQMLDKAGVGMSGDTEQDAQRATGQLVGGVIMQTIEPQMRADGLPNPYAGRVRSQVQSWFRPGEKEPGIDADLNGGDPNASVMARARNAAAMSPTSVATAPAHAAPAPAPAPAAPKPAVAAAAKTVKAKDKLPCPVCNQQIPRAEFGAHVEGCTGQPQAA